MKKTKYWFKDNWHGTIRSFTSLKEAKAAAEKEDGVSITIFRNNGSIVETVKANGYVYP